MRELIVHVGRDFDCRPWLLLGLLLSLAHAVAADEHGLRLGKAVYKKANCVGCHKWHGGGGGGYLSGTATLNTDGNIAIAVGPGGKHTSTASAAPNGSDASIAGIASTIGGGGGGGGGAGANSEAGAEVSSATASSERRMLGSRFSAWNPFESQP